MPLSYLIEHCSFFINLSLIYKFTAPRFFIFSQNIIFFSSPYCHTLNIVKSQDLPQYCTRGVPETAAPGHLTINDLSPLPNNWNVKAVRYSNNRLWFRHCHVQPYQVLLQVQSHFQ